MKHQCDAWDKGHLALQRLSLGEKPIAAIIFLAFLLISTSKSCEVQSQKSTWSHSRFYIWVLPTCPQYNCIFSMCVKVTH